MPVTKDSFIKVEDNLSKVIDVDDSRGRSVPININFIEEGYLAKDTGVSLFGATEVDNVHSPFVYKKKNGTKYIIRAKGTALQVYSDGVWANIVGTPVFTANAEFGYQVYNDDLYFGNGVEALYKWDDTTFTAYASAPKGNILQIFEDRLFISGVSTEPLTVYYSNVGVPTTFSGADLLKPLGTDAVVGLLNYYGTLLIFKTESIWKLTFVYDQVVNLFVPKLEIQSQNYGACSRKAITWVENDIWFFTGVEVRSIGYKDQQIGILGVNNSVISDKIKETLATLSVSNYSKVSVFYYNRRFYLSLALNSTTNNTTFVCHLLYGNNWTKYSDRIKASAQGYFEDEGVIYTAKSVTPYGILKWDTSFNDNGTAIPSEVFFTRIEERDFNQFVFYRYLDLMFKNLQAVLTVTIKDDANDTRSLRGRQFVVGLDTVADDLSLGQTPVGNAQYGDSYGQDIENSPFQKKRVSFLIKAQSIVMGISHNRADESFTLAQYAISGHKRPRRQFKTQNIVSI